MLFAELHQIHCFLQSILKPLCSDSRTPKITAQNSSTLSRWFSCFLQNFIKYFVFCNQSSLLCAVFYSHRRLLHRTLVRTLDCNWQVITTQTNKKPFLQKKTALLLLREQPYKDIKFYFKLYAFVECSLDYFKLLFLWKSAEVYSVSRNSNS